MKEIIVAKANAINAGLTAARLQLAIDELFYEIMAKVCAGDIVTLKSYEDNFGAFEAKPSSKKGATEDERVPGKVLADFDAGDSFVTNVNTSLRVVGTDLLVRKFTVEPRA